MIFSRTSCRALCNETANRNLTLSSAIFLIIFGIPEVESVILFGDIARPSGCVILSIAAITFL